MICQWCEQRGQQVPAVAICRTIATKLTVALCAEHATNQAFVFVRSLT